MVGRAPYMVGIGFRHDLQIRLCMPDDVLWCQCVRLSEIQGIISAHVRRHSATFCIARKHTCSKMYASMHECARAHVHNAGYMCRHLRVHVSCVACS